MGIQLLSQFCERKNILARKKVFGRSGECTDEMMLVSITCRLRVQVY